MGAINKLFAVLCLALVLIGGAGHQHEDGSTQAPQCSACDLGQAAGVASVDVLPAVAPPVTFVAAATPAPALKPSADVLSFAPKTSPPSPSI